MSSIDKSKVVGVRDGDLLEYTCAICLVYSPNRCSHCAVHRSTADSALWLTNESTCPIDRTYPTTVDLLPAPRPLVNLLEKLKVKCHYEELGCGQVVRIRDLSQHSKVCELQPDKPCIGCGLIKVLDKDYDCLKALIAENSRLNTENKRLLDENILLANKRNSFNLNLLNLFERRPALKHILLILGVQVVLLSGLLSPENNNFDHLRRL